MAVIPIEEQNDPSEQKTREELIDPELKKQGWLWKYVKEEVNTVRSDFQRSLFLFKDKDPRQKGDRYSDYVLLDEDNSVLAVIEAKRFSKDEKKGRIQARSYAKDIEAQIGRKIPIFLTNGKKWKFIDETGIERKISGPFSQEDLSRRGALFRKRRDLTTVQIDTRIIDRPRSKIIVKELCEHFSAGHRKALVQMATGTGKTRVAMAISKILIDANMVRNVLFVADRTALVNQANSEGFKQFFTEPIVDIRKEVTESGRLYVSTVQTLMNPSREPKHREFSPGFFDLVIYDEAHRSFYDRNRTVMKYFDSLVIGLTATPSKHETRNTYELFDCHNDKPTVEYSYEEAVREDILVKYRAQIIETEVLELGIDGKELPEHLKDQLRRQEVDPETADFAGSEFDKVFMDDRTNELIIRKFMEVCYKSDDGKPCKSIFFCASRRHAKHLKGIFGKLFPILGNDVQEITYEMARAADEIDRFKLQSEPRVALSVGMLDTGVNIPEICNIVFVKPIYSSIRFWQMVGRGTRNLKSCKHKEWLPQRDKRDFLILDFVIGEHSNITMHEFEETKEKNPAVGVVRKIFENRVGLLEKCLDSEQKGLISEKIISTVNQLDRDSFIVREKIDTIDRVRDNAFNLDQYLKDLRDEIAPLMMLIQAGHATVASFILQVEKLFRHILDENHEGMFTIERNVRSMVGSVLRKENLEDVKSNREHLVSVLQEQFWDDLTFARVEFLVKTIAPLMRYYEPDGKEIIQSDAPDTITSITHFVKDIPDDKKLTAFLAKNPFIEKIKSGEGITGAELLELEQQLAALRPEITVENVQKYYGQDFVIFLLEMIGLPPTEDPKGIIEKRFDEFILQTDEYNSKQLEFLILLQKVFSERKYINLEDLAKMPFTEEPPLDYFNIDELREIVKKCNSIKVC